MPNRLAQTNSPYLLQHADNPVDWYPWGEAAFEKARAEDRPIFLSIGYATCHWCHVMAHESFEDEGVARMMNEAFVNVKVDREERPDVDGVYMAVAQALTGHGGWPLTVVMKPDGQPFFAGTYFPRESRPGRIGMLDLVPRIANLWREDRARIERSAETIVAAVRADLEGATPGAALGEDALRRGYETLRARFDAEHGGFGGAPKFPTPHQLLFLLRYADRTGDEEALAMGTATLAAMRRGGIWDHVGYGFHRYSTDRHWLLPHFEKMLYDQALLAMAYTEAYQVTGDVAFRETVEQILAYVDRDLTSPDGAFYSAEDADSLGRDGHMEEGAFYVWTEAELAEVLGEEEARIARAAFGTRPDGNFFDEATRQKVGANVLHHPAPLVEVADSVGLGAGELRDRLAAVRARLFEARQQRPRPLLDDKILTDWNGLMIAAQAKAGRAFGVPEFADRAARAAAFLLGRMRDDGGRLLHRYREGEAAILGHLDDYAFLVWGLLELYETTFEEHYLRDALDLHRRMQARFADAEHGGLFFTDAEAEPLIARQKAYYDGAIPSGNAVAMLNGLRLGRLTGDAGMEREAEAIGTSSSDIAVHPVAHAFSLIAADFALGPVREVVVAGERGAEDTRALLAVLGRAFLPRVVVALRAPGEGPAPITEWVPYAAPQVAVDGQATAYVCEDYACRAPVTEVGALREALGLPVSGG